MKRPNSSLLPRASAIAICAGALLLSLPALAQKGGGGAGTRGGGEIVDVDGTPTLRDLVDKAVCVENKTGAEMIAETHGAFGEIMSKVAERDWYFSGDVRRKLEKLKFCLVDAPIIPTDEPDMPGCVQTTTDDLSPRNVAYRHDDRVVLVRPLFYGDQDQGGSNKPLPDFVRGLLLTHETFHSYLDQNLPWCDRRQELWTMVKDVAKIDSFNRETFHRAMEGNDFMFPTKVAFLDPFEIQLEFLLSSEKDRRQKLLDAPSVESVTEVPVHRIAEALTWQDRDYLGTNPPGEIATRTIAEILEHGSLDDFARMVSKPGVGERNPALVGLALLDRLPAERQSALFQSPGYANVLTDAYRGLTQDRAPVYVERDRVRASVELQAKLGAEPHDGLPLLDMDVYATDGLPREALAVAQQIVILANAGTPAAIDALKARITENPDFYSAFGWKTQRARIDEIAADPKHVIDRDPGYAQGRLLKLRDRFLGRFFKHLEHRLDPATYATVDGMFHKDWF